MAVSFQKPGEAGPAAAKVPVTSKNALMNLYDIETLTNVFTLCSYMPSTGVIEAFYLIDDDGGELAKHVDSLGGKIDFARATERIIAENPAWHGAAETAPASILAAHGGVGGKHVAFHDLRTLAANIRLATMFGLSDAKLVNDPRSESNYPSQFRLVCDTDPGYDPVLVPGQEWELDQKHPYLGGYNSFNYDTTILALYLWKAFEHVSTEQARGLALGTLFKPPVASELRAWNDRIFRDHIDQMPGFLRTFGEDGDRGGWNAVPNRIRQAMIMSGRHIDFARLNEVQKKVALKRLLGGLGSQMLESDNLGTHDSSVKSAQDFYELLAYNVSDVVGLDTLRNHRVYAGAFDLKKGLLDEYPETVYDKRRDSYAPDVRPSRVRRNRLRPDSTSAQFVGLILSPYGHLDDIPSVSFMYPSEPVAKELGIERVDVLEATKEFFEEQVSDEAARAAFREVYDYYASIRGKNFNDSNEYAATHGHLGLVPHELKNMPKARLNLPYFKADGSHSSCFATFSTGGIHGAEANVALWEADAAEYRRQETMLATAKMIFPDPRDLVAESKAQQNRITLPEAKISFAKADVVIGSDPEKAKWRGIKKGTEKHPLTADQQRQNLCIKLAMLELDTPAELLALARPADRALTLDLADGSVIELKTVLSNTTAKSAAYREKPSMNRPSIFEETVHPDGSGTSNKLKAKYTFTSADAVIHEDFTSYYPNMLRNISAFYNKDLGTDRYAKILADKDLYGKMMKAEGITEEEKERLGVLRNGTKLILNSASGAGDTTFTGQPIRVNNKIISMRLLGQLFSWRIGQAQTLAGARIVSTNTDGLYSVLDEETNNRVLEEQAALIHVEIEPEPMVIVSKDSNNRLELVPDDTEPTGLKMTTAGGGSLACFKEPRPDKSLAHPAVLDWALARYLRYVAASHEPEWRQGDPLTMEQSMDPRLAEEIIAEALALEDRVLSARLFQNIVAASSGMITFPFASDFEDPLDPDGEKTLNPRSLQHYNRVFYTKRGTEGTVSLQAAGAWKVTPAQKITREREGRQSVSKDPIADLILRKEGFASNNAEILRNPGLRLVPEDQDTAVRRISGIDPSWPVLVENDDLREMSDERLAALIDSLDPSIYVGMLMETYEKNWRNVVPDAA